MRRMHAQLCRGCGPALILTMAIIGGASSACRRDPAATVAEAKASATAEGSAIDTERARMVRDDALRRARVWSPPATPVGQANLRTNPFVPGRIDESEEIACRFEVRKVGGTTPKFYCQLPDGEQLKVKYGSNNPELHGEVAASRLLAALGFAADHMFIAKRVRCAGCPSFPFQSLRCFERVGMEAACFAGGIDYNRVIDFDTVVLERKLQGRVIEGIEDQGWAWYELDRVDPSVGGSSRAEVDALRLMAVFLAHWDNKAPNQRLICPTGADDADGTCRRPMALMQDLGATFGPLKIDLHNWRQGQIWKDGASCTVSMEHLPFGGATFPEHRISEAGRRLLLGLLEQLSDQQLRDLFEGSRITTHEQFSAESRRPDAWVEVFKDKVRQIRAGGPCAS